MYSKRNSRFDETQKETWSDYGNGVVSFGMLVIVCVVCSTGKGWQADVLYQQQLQFVGYVRIKTQQNEEKPRNEQRNDQLPEVVGL